MAQAREYSTVTHIQKKIAFCALLLFAFSAVANPLQESYEAALISARQDASAATETWKRRVAVEKEVAALNSLGRSAEALERLDFFDASVSPERRTVDLRAKVLLALDRCGEALVLLDDSIRAREEVERKKRQDYEPGGYLITGREDLIAAAYCHVRARKFDEAVNSLSRVIDFFNPTTRQYTVAWYSALRTAGAQSNARMENEALHVSRQASGHAVSLAVAQRRMTLAEARRAITSLRLDPSSEQDALAEVIFFHAFVEGSRDVQADALQRLNVLAPYGSAEWLMAKYLFNPMLVK